MRHGLAHFIRTADKDDAQSLVDALADAVRQTPRGPWVANRKDFKPDGKPWVNLAQCDGLHAPNLKDSAGRCAQIETYRRGLWAALKSRNRVTVSALAGLTEEHTIVCECKPGPCHGDVVIAAWRWAKKEGILR